MREVDDNCCKYLISTITSAITLRQCVNFWLHVANSANRLSLSFLRWNLLNLMSLLFTQLWNWNCQLFFYSYCVTCSYGLLGGHENIEKQNEVFTADAVLLISHLLLFLHVSIMPWGVFFSTLADQNLYWSIHQKHREAWSIADAELHSFQRTNNKWTHHDTIMWSASEKGVWQWKTTKRLLAEEHWAIEYIDANSIWRCGKTEHHEK